MTTPNPRKLLLTVLSAASWISLPFLVFFLLSDRQEALLRTDAWPQLERDVRRTAETVALEVTADLLEEVREVAISEARRQVLLADSTDPFAVPPPSAASRTPPAWDPSAVLPLVLGRPKHLSVERNGVVWLGFEVDSDADYLIDVVGSDVASGTSGRRFDPYLRLYRKPASGGAPILLAIDDDGGEEPLASQLTRRLDPGHYYVQVEEYRGFAGEFSVSVQPL